MHRRSSPGGCEEFLHAQALSRRELLRVDAAGLSLAAQAQAASSSASRYV